MQESGSRRRLGNQLLCSFWQHVQQFAEWAHDGEPIWYMHCQWTLEGCWMNYLAKMHERAKTRLLWLEVEDLQVQLQQKIAFECGRIRSL